ncbi:sulfate adenylyltransferase subunit CysN [Blochmannia endosymbiont of Camponotus (Colobopsis) obliquus]|uniref:sulfate adenylyltransferase subunit CysN n=1 Tax=Blochmannia endosymbiont of Camponotus (Colobopsis) obliquus TaxID=1505597 RepID=UPI00061A7AD0|nr:sulfate adenylyltransferase subunit CysN [Blochmannia endosymbiont of Camponotus (Colobopsis) obliquus]AKC60338.1 sulfate adenylyltransferase subunit 1 [Blochmannia endosymbiont of Camponotus (Colobopsis) obliquus]
MNITKQQIKQQGGIRAYLYAQQYNKLLRFLTCGSVDDGKSTLIGRLLHDTNQICDDQLLKLYNDSKRLGYCDDTKLDLALLLDGLQDEQAQGITIDVAYRYFFTSKRKFIIADTPGHEQYTRNMVTGASTSDAAILLIDVRKGLREQTKRHSFISILLGISYLVVVVNKMDLVNYNHDLFEKIKQDYLIFVNQLSVNINIVFIPLSALNGDNVIKKSSNMSWYHGSTLLDILENIDLTNCPGKQKSYALRFPVQYIIRRSDLDFRGYSGSIASGKICVGQLIKILPSKIISKVDRIITVNGDCKEAWAGEAITLTLADNVDLSRGDLVIDKNEILHAVSCVIVDVVWMSEQALVVGQVFDIKVANKISYAFVKNIQYQINIVTLDRHVVDSLPLNGIGSVELCFDEPLFLDMYSDNKITGGIIFIDRLSNVTVGIGMVRKLLIKDCDKQSNIYTDFELALNSLVCHYYPHWGARNLSEDT